uniref:Uncharacterized protein n=1 Tax=Tanacetum cinerariifolium TaxID=118510 RepID=A0A699KET3_TANCI|nr:hypothetical protein [Tanacetum cinerariifolium]
MIQDMIGIPMGSIAVTEVPAATTEFLRIVEWRKTYKHIHRCQLLYVHATISEQVVVEDPTPLMKSWKIRREYKESQRFEGPLVLMVLLYVHVTIYEQVVIEDPTPLMKSWDTMKLKLREKEELNMGIWAAAH